MNNHNFLFEMWKMVRTPAVVGNVVVDILDAEGLVVDILDAEGLVVVAECLVLLDY